MRSGRTRRPTPSCTARPTWRIRSPAPPPTPRSICSSANRDYPRSPPSRLRCGQGLRPAAACSALGVVALDRIDDADELRRRFVAEGVFVRPFGATVYLTPAFTIVPEELARLTDAVVRVVGELK